MAQRSHWPWLPLARNGTLAPHPYCQDCGLVRSVGVARPLDLGGITNLLPRLARQFEQAGVVFTEAQRRLVVRSVQRQRLDDGYALSREAQTILLAQTIGATVGLGRSVIESYLRSC